MTNLLRSIRSGAPLGLDEYAESLIYQGLGYGLPFTQTMAGQKTEEIHQDFAGFAQQAYKSNGIIFACMLVRMLLFSEARFQFRQMVRGRPGNLFGTRGLELLEKPWPNGTTGNLLSRAIQDVDLEGNFYATVIGSGASQRLQRLRPDWMTIVLGSRSEPDLANWALDAELIGYAYYPGGRGGLEPQVLLPEEVVHFAPIPDPFFRFRGMSWLTPVIREIMADGAATTHKLKFFENGATPNMVVSLDASIRPNEFGQWMSRMREHEGVLNAYKTLYLGAGATATPVGANMRQIDFKATQGAGETRIAAAAGVPPVIVGLSEGLAAATYSNYGQARRRFADGTMRPLWREMAGALAPIVNVPNNAQLWYDDRDIPFLQEDLRDAAEIQRTQAATIRSLIDSGYKPDSVIAAVQAENWDLLEHTGLFSVQLQKPGESAGMPPLPKAPVAPGPV